MRFGALLLALSVAGCVGEIVEPGAGSGEPAEPGTNGGELECAGVAPDTEAGVVRMLNRREYANTIRDLLGMSVEGLPADPVVGFDNVAESLVASALHVEKQMEVAETVAAEVDVATLAPCASGADEGACADEFIASFGRRAYRRTPSAEEAGVLRGLYDTARSAGRTYEQAIRLVIEAALQSPQFLYRIEDSAEPLGVVAVKGFELASRLSYFLWASMPDDALLDAAEQGELASREQIEAEVRRMLADPKARATTTAFHELWLELGMVETAAKNSDVIADFAPLGGLFRQESTQFAEWVFWNGDGGADRLLVSDVGFVNDALAQHYGLPLPGSSSLVQVSLAGSERVGVLTQGAFLASHSNPDRTSPTKRGKFVRQQLLCQPPPPPPSDVPALPAGGTGGEKKSIRDMLAAHVSDPACSGCHVLIDPIGFGFEKYDTVGRFLGDDIDDSGELVEVTGGEGKFVGARELSERIAQTEEYYQCVATQWYRFALGRREGKRDGCSLQSVVQEFRGAGDSLPELVVAVALSDGFLHKNTGNP